MHVLFLEQSISRREGCLYCQVILIYATCCWCLFNLRELFSRIRIFGTHSNRLDLWDLHPLARAAFASKDFCRILNLAAGITSESANIFQSRLRFLWHSCIINHHYVAGGFWCVVECKISSPPAKLKSASRLEQHDALTRLLSYSQGW